VRPSRDDIAAPEFPPRLRWLSDPPASMSELTAAGPVLVHFFEFAQLNSVRALPYVLEWHRRYERQGLSTLGVQAPRFPFGFDPDVVAAGLDRLGVAHPVALDSERELWQDYGCTGWPSLFLWSRGGALRWVHFGEGEYASTEEAIQALLGEDDPLTELPVTMEPLRESDAPGARVMPPSDEVFPGGAQGQPWTADGQESLELPYEAGGAHVTAEGRGGIEVEIDGAVAGTVGVPAPGLYTLAEHPRHEAHRLTLRPTADLKVWSVSFSAGVPGSAPG
jgi:hypothetical protein